MTDATEAIAGLRWARAYNTEHHIRPRQIVELLAHIDAQAAEIERLRAENKRLRDGLPMHPELFEEGPCYLCGYNGPGYYQPQTHPCAARYHAAMEVKE